MLAGIFIVGGFDAFRDPESKAKMADDVAPWIAEKLRLPTTDTVALVRINGAIQVIAGTMLALGKGRRLSALVLAASLIPTTYAGHRYWDELDEEQRAQQRIQFLKNFAILGGLVLAAGDTGGRATVAWQVRRGARHAAEAAAAASALTEHAAQHMFDSTGQVHDAFRDRGVELAHQAHRVAQATEMTGPALRAAKKAAMKATKAQFSRHALKAAKKAAKSALRNAGSKADTSALRRRATGAARRGAKKAQRSEVGRRAGAAASRAHQATSDALGRVSDVRGDNVADWARGAAAGVSHEIVARAHDARALASTIGS